MVLILGLDEPAGALERFAHDFAQTVRRIERPGEQPALVRGSGWFDNEVVVPPREAFLGAAEAVPSTRRPAASRPSRSPATRRASPRCCPGERITAELVAYLRELRDAGARLHGASDPSFDDHLRPRGHDRRRAGRRAPWRRTSGTATSRRAATVDAAARGRATITQKAPGVISGLGVAEAVFRRLDPDAAIERLGPEGEWREAGAGVLRVEGSARALLTAERTALNFLGRLSGVATLTATRRARDPRRPAARRSCSTRARPRRACARWRSARSPTAAASTTAPGSTTSSSSRRTTPRSRAAWGRRCGARARPRPDLPLAVEVRDPRGDRRGARGRRAAAAAGQHEPGRDPRRGGAGGRPGGARGVRRDRPGDGFGLCDHFWATLRVDGGAHPLRPRPSTSR